METYHFGVEAPDLGIFFLGTSKVVEVTHFGERAGSALLPARMLWLLLVKHFGGQIRTVFKVADGDEETG